MLLLSSFSSFFDCHWQSHQIKFLLIQVSLGWNKKGFSQSYSTFSDHFIQWCLVSSFSVDTHSDWKGIIQTAVRKYWKSRCHKLWMGFPSGKFVAKSWKHLDWVSSKSLLILNSDKFCIWNSSTGVKRFYCFFSEKCHLW